MATEIPPFHLAIEVSDLPASRRFYGKLLQCAEGRSSDRWVDFNFFGHQLVCHQTHDVPPDHKDPASNPVDGHNVPVPHFGVVLDMETWSQMANRLRDAGVKFVIEPHTRFKGEAGEQATMFLIDPSGNALEFKAFRHIESQLFAT
jgi:extradiol dioxygenase family protein